MFTESQRTLIVIWITHPTMTKDKISAAKTLVHRTKSIPNHEEGKRRELNQVITTLKTNGYPQKIIKEVIEKQTRETTPDPEDVVGIFFRWVDPSPANSGYAVLPDIRGLTEVLSRTLRKHDINVYNKPLTTLGNAFRSPKYRHPINELSNVI